MKNMVLKMIAVIGLLTMFASIGSCSNSDECAENPQLCIATCLTSPDLCIDEDGKQIEIQIDSVEAVSKLPIRH